MVHFPLLTMVKIFVRRYLFEIRRLFISKVSPADFISWSSTLLLPYLLINVNIVTLSIEVGIPIICKHENNEIGNVAQTADMDEVVLKGVNRGVPRFSRETEGEWTGPFHFIQGADTQFGMIDEYVLKLPIPNWDKEIALTTQAVAAANKMQPKPRFFIVCGDLTHIFPENDLVMKEKQEQDFLKVFSELDPEIPLICVCGNHDIGNQPTVQAVDRYKGKFGDDYLSFWVGGVFCIVLNSQFYEDPSQVAQLAAEQEDWLDEQLATIQDCRPKHAILFQHIPWFLQTPDEPKEYFNIEPELRAKMLEKFKAAGIKTIFCGHYHRNAGGFYQNMELVVTSAIGAALGTDPSGLRVVKVQETAIEHTYYPLADIPTEITFD